MPILFAPGVVPESFKPLLNVGAHTGLSYFFVLSGFVLTYAVRPGDTAVRFWRRRATRVYPVNFLVTLGAIAFLVSIGSTATVHHVPEALVLIQPWFLSTSSVGINPVTWSLACDVFFYLCFPVLLLLINKINPARLVFWMCGIVAAIFTVPLIAQALFADAPTLPFSPVSEKQYLFTGWFPPARMLEFVLGIMLARVVLSGRWGNVPRWFAWALLAVAVGIGTMFDPALHTIVAVTIIPVTLVIGSTASVDLHGGSRFLGSRGMVHLGNLSFTFYVLHVLVLMNVPMLFTAVTNWTFMSVLGALLASFAITFVLSVLLHYCFEQPIYRRFANPRARKKAAAPPALDASQSDPPANPRDPG